MSSMSSLQQSWIRKKGLYSNSLKLITSANSLQLSFVKRDNPNNKLQQKKGNLTL